MFLFLFQSTLSSNFHLLLISFLVKTSQILTADTLCSPSVGLDSQAFLHRGNRDIQRLIWKVTWWLFAFPPTDILCKLMPLFFLFQFLGRVSATVYDKVTSFSLTLRKQKSSSCLAKEDELPFPNFWSIYQHLWTSLCISDTWATISQKVRLTLAWCQGFCHFLGQRIFGFFRCFSQVWHTRGRGQFYRWHVRGLGEARSEKVQMW